MTSNIGSDYIMTEDDPEKRHGLVTEALRGHFRPEFLNRIDETIIFDRLSEEDIKKIVKLQIQRVLERLEAQGVELKVSDEAMTLLAKEGYDPAYGARPLKRVIQKRLLDPLSMEILEGKFSEGDKVKVGAKGDELTFEG